jgi:hypothetical protein
MIEMLTYAYAKPLPLRIVRFRSVIPQSAPMGEKFRRNEEVSKTRGEAS